MQAVQVGEGFKDMRKLKMYILLSMVALAVLLVIMMKISPTFDIIAQISLYYGSLVILVIDIIAIVSYIAIILVFKDSEVSQIMRYTAISTVGIFITIIVLIASNPLRRSETHIEEGILKITPIGTSIEEVFSVVDEKKWVIDPTGEQKPGMPSSQFRKDEAIERKRIDAVIGEYRTIFDTGVSVFWYFDDDLKLIDVEVRKDHDSI